LQRSPRCDGRRDSGILGGGVYELFHYPAQNLLIFHALSAVEILTKDVGDHEAKTADLRQRLF
jgi:hypothetical protein